jgi:hypothetical protein
MTDKTALIPAPGDVTLRRAREVNLISVGNRIVSSDGRWHPNLVVEYLCEHGGRTRQITTGELARVFFSGNTPMNRRSVRRRMHKVFHEGLSRGLLIVSDIDSRLGLQACKLYDPRSSEERQYLDDRLNRMRRAGQLKEEQLDLVLTLRATLDAAVEPV